MQNKIDEQKGIINYDGIRVEIVQSKQKNHDF